MPMQIRRLTPGDEAIVRVLAVEDAAFDLEGRGGPRAPLTVEQARCFLANPAVLFWVAFEDEAVTGFLHGVVLPLRAGVGQELLLYEIGVRMDRRRQGVGRALHDHMIRWMRENEVSEAWVLADNPGAVEFYRACGFEVQPAQPVYLTLELEG